MTTLNAPVSSEPVRQPRSGHRARRWLLWLVLILLTLAPVFLCQAVSSSSELVPSTSAATVSADCDGGHDALCARGTAVATGASPRSGRGGEPELLLTLAVAAAVIGTIRRLPGSSSGAPQRLLPGRQQLLALGIARI